MLIGLCGAELVGPDSVGASEGFLGWIAYLGAANAGARPGSAKRALPQPASHATCGARCAQCGGSQGSRCLAAERRRHRSACASDDARIVHGVGGGASHAGIPLSIIVKEYGWSAYFSTLVAACGVALVLLSPMTNLRSQVQRDEKRARKAA